MKWFSGEKVRFVALCAGSEVVLLILFFALVRYSPQADRSKAIELQETASHGNVTHQEEEDEDLSLSQVYPMFQDVHVMILVGFGFLMTFLKRYGFGAVGLNMVVSGLVMQWAMVSGGLVHTAMEAAKGEHVTWEIPVGAVTLLESDFTCAAVLISFGALIGKVTPFQLLLLALVEVVVFKANESFGLHVLHAADLGGSIFVHVFGAYFGLAASRVLNKRSHHSSPNEGAEYHSDLFSMVGSLFLWVFWPSFNSALAVDEERTRAVINTYLALCGSCVAAFALSALSDRRGRLSMEHVQNATLAGGVAVGSAANMMLQPGGALLIGICAGCLSVAGFSWLQPLLGKWVGLHDSCGVNNLHGMPGLMAGLASALVSFLATEDAYGGSMDHVFSKWHSPAEQAGRQLAALGLTLIVALASGALMGLALRIPCINTLDSNQLFLDHPFWNEAGEEDDRHENGKELDQHFDAL